MRLPVACRFMSLSPFTTGQRACLITRPFLPTIRHDRMRVLPGTDSNRVCLQASKDYFYLLLSTPVNELLLGSGLGGLGLVPRFRRDSPRDQQQLREQAAK